MAKNKSKKIVLNGIETVNKGAELMLYAILQQVESKYPNAKVYLPYFASVTLKSPLKTNLKVKKIPFLFLRRVAFKLKLPGIFKRLGFNNVFFTQENFVKNVDYYLDGSGFAISDQWSPNSETVESWDYLFNKYGRGKSKSIFLPQAFGPAENPNTKKILSLMADKIDFIFPREKTSYDWIEKTVGNKDNIKIYPDFTILVKGIIPEKYKHLKDSICVIPNARMIDKGASTSQNYINIIKTVIDTCQKYSKRQIYILNHEGKQDEQLAKEIGTQYKDLEVVTGLNALEVKGLISTSYLCISSRFHGVISALNSCVPCLSTSWSHKYEELYKDYDLSGMVLDISDPDAVKHKVLEYLNPQKNRETREHIAQSLPILRSKVEDMWQIVWTQDQIS